MQIGKALMNHRISVSKVSWKYLPVKFAIFLKSSLLFNSFYCLLLLINKTLRLNTLKTRAAMNAKLSVFDICVEVIIYLLSHNLHDCTFNNMYSGLYTFKPCRCMNILRKSRGNANVWTQRKNGRTKGKRKKSGFCLLPCTKFIKIKNLKHFSNRQIRKWTLFFVLWKKAVSVLYALSTR